MSFSEKLANFVNKALNAIEPFDPSSLKDPVADNTEWSPIGSGFANFTTHKLYKESNSTLIYKRTISIYAIPVIFSIIFISIIFTLTSKIAESAGNIPYYIAFVISAFILSLAILSAKKLVKLKVFDKEKGLYFTGNKFPDNPLYKPDVNECFLNEIHAIQLLHKQVHSSSNPVTYYEINFVKRNCTRINILVDKSGAKIREDAAVISKFLNIPVWDAMIAI